MSIFLYFEELAMIQKEREVETIRNNNITSPSVQLASSKNSNFNDETRYTYTSLKDLLPSESKPIDLYKTEKDIKLKNPLLQKAAWCYIMSAEPVSNDKGTLSSRLWKSKLDVDSSSDHNSSLGYDSDADSSDHHLKK